MPVGGSPYCEGVLLFGTGINTIPELCNLPFHVVWVLAMICPGDAYAAD